MAKPARVCLRERAPLSLCKKPPSHGNYICPTSETVCPPKRPSTVSPAKPSTLEGAIFKHRRLTHETVRLIGDTVKKFRRLSLTLGKCLTRRLIGPIAEAPREAVSVRVPVLQIEVSPIR